MDCLFHGLKFILAYIDDILILKKGDWKYHVQKLEFTLNKLKGKMPECNMEKSFFRHTEM